MRAACRRALALEWCRIPGTGRSADTRTRWLGEAAGAVALPAYEITRTPVTEACYDDFIAAGGYESERYWTVLGWRYRRLHGWTGPARHPERERRPDAAVTGVSWWEAMAFACWAEAMLPSCAQWERAARSIGARPPRADTDACVPIDLRTRSIWSHPAGRDLAGALDLSDHVSEWCLDNVDATADAPGGARVHVAHRTVETDRHALRGSCPVRGTTRRDAGPWRRDELVGFRLVRPAAAGS